MVPLSLELHAGRVALAAGTALFLVASCGTAPALPSDMNEESGPPATPALPQEPEPESPETSAELLAKLQIGWNLGNSLEAPENETAWGNPVVTPELLQAVAGSGFRLVRIPVTWALHMGPAPDFQIDPGWLERVEQVVGYAQEAGLYVIINLHHDGADGFELVEWITLNDATGAVTEANNQAVRARFVAVWDQIARHFAGFGEDLLFESMNEIHDGYGTPDPRYFTIVNALNQAFVDAVRSAGGNNQTRHLVVPGYNTNIDHTLAGFEAPEDPTRDRLILSAHYYDPYLFALQGETHTWGSASPGNDGWGQEDFVAAQFDKLKTRFIDQGLPVILGEYGACHQEGFEDYRRYYMEYVTTAAAVRGIVPVYWDNGAEGSGAEKFALFSRQTNAPLHPNLLEAMLRAASGEYPLSEVALPAP